MSGLVSVVIPTFNRAHVLRDAIDSVLAQDRPDLELIVVDDGSTDGTSELVRAAAAADARLRYVRQSNAGAATARNAGLDQASGDYVAFLDSDDSWKPWHLRLAVAVLDRHPQVGMVWSNIDFVDAQGRTTSSMALDKLFSAYRYFSLPELFADSWPLSELGVKLPGDVDARCIYVGDIFSPMVMGNLVLTSSAVLRRSRLDEVGRFDHGLPVGEDYDFFMRVCRAGPVAFADVADTAYRVGTPDKLGSPANALAMARGYLAVLDRTLATDADRIALPPGFLTLARAHAQSWLGEMLLLDGQGRSARARLATAMRLRPKPRILVLLALTFVPFPALRAMIRWRRTLRSSKRSRAHP